MAPKKKLSKALMAESGKIMRVEDPKATDMIIPVMGPTGAGKSTFINKITGNPKVLIGHKLESCTSNVDHFIIPHPRDPTRRMILVDTPGFDDTYVDDGVILRQIALWLARSYHDEMRVAGIIYLHEISQTRMHGTSRKNLVMFTHLCGDSALKNVILATTKWGKITEDEGREREVDLESLFWKKMKDRGSTVTRFMNTTDSAWDIIKPVLDNEAVDLRIQQELIDLQKQLPETEAGKCLRQTLEELLEQQKEIARQTKTDPGLRAKYEETQKEVRSTMKQIKDLKVSSRVARFFGF